MLMKFSEIPTKTPKCISRVHIYLWNLKLSTKSCNDVIVGEMAKCAPHDQRSYIPSGKNPSSLSSFSFLVYLQSISVFLLFTFSLKGQDNILSSTHLFLSLRHSTSLHCSPDLYVNFLPRCDSSGLHFSCY